MNKRKQKSLKTEVYDYKSLQLRDYRKLTKRLTNKINENTKDSSTQEELANKLVDLENKFQKTIKSYEQSKTIYKEFIYYIHNVLGNILSAKPYFRETSGVINNKINKAISMGNVDELIEFKINYQLIDFIMNRWINPPKRLSDLFEKIKYTRNILIENNIPLAINMAKRFQRKTYTDKFELMDYIDICVCGLAVGIDKFVGEYSSKWVSTCIGRMVGFLIEEYSKPFIYLYPADKKILYRANSLRYSMHLDNISDITKAVNDSFQKDIDEGRRAPKLPIKEELIIGLLNSMGYDNLPQNFESNSDYENDRDGSSLNESNITDSIYNLDTNQDNVTEDKIERRDLVEKINNSMSSLKIIEIKVIKLKGMYTEDL